MKKTTMEELRARSPATITPAEAAQIIGCDPQYIREAARNHPDTLGFPTWVIGKRVHIPYRPFANALGYDA